MQDGMTAVQRLAIQRLIRAKSDREIARLLRKSHRLLNLHRRRGSGISHSERWTDYELRLVGRIRDEELAKLLRRTSTAVAANRESLDIPIFSPQRIRWLSREIELLGRRSNAAVARILGRTRYAGAIKAPSHDNVPELHDFSARPFLPYFHHLSSLLPFPTPAIRYIVEILVA